MTDSPPAAPRNPDFDWIPRPDPTLLTNEAIDRVTTEYRREMGTLRELLDIRIDTLRILLDERYATQTKALDAAFRAAEQAVAVALANAEKAVAKAESAADKRFEGVNEFRQALTDQTATFLPRPEYSTAHRALEEKLTALTERANTLELRLTSRLDLSSGTASGAADQRAEGRAEREGLSQVAIMIITCVSVLVSIASVIALILKK